MAVPADSPKRYQAALILAVRLFKRPDAPFGISGGTEVGFQRVQSFDPDVTRLLRGTRSATFDPVGQTWPDLAALKAAVDITDNANDVELQDALDAAVADISDVCSSLPAGLA